MDLLKKYSCFLLLLPLCFNIFVIEAAAESLNLEKEMQNLEEKISLKEIEDMLENSSLKGAYSFTDLIKQFIQGDFEESGKILKEIVYQCFLKELDYNRSNFVKIILVAILSALFSNIASGFLASSLQETGFYAVYVTMTGIVLNSFFLMISIARQALQEVFAFMEALIPAYAIAITMVSGSASSFAVYQMTFLIMKGCQWALKTILIPLIEIHMIVGIVNYLGETERFSYMGELIKKATEQILKWSLGIILGIQLIQNMILPAVDSVKSGIWQKGLSAIPGAGPVLSVVTGSLLGSSVLIKNSVGVGGLIFLALICIVPAIKILILMMSFYLCAAFLQPISDKRLMSLLYGAGESGRLVLQVVITCFALFFITIALAAVSTNMRYYAG